MSQVFPYRLIITDVRPGVEPDDEQVIKQLRVELGDNAEIVY